MVIKMFSKLIVAFSLVSGLMSGAVYAQKMDKQEKAVAAKFKKAAMDLRKIEIEPTVRKTKFKNLFEVVVENKIQGYVDKDITFLMAGNLLDGKNFESLTSAREEDLNRVDIKSLPLKQAIKIVNGKGTRKLYTIEDPRCTFCKKLAKEVENMKDVTMYIFPVGFLGPESIKQAEAIMCDKDPKKAWFDTLLNAKVPENDGKCKNNYVSDNSELARKLNVRGTPAIIFPDGSRSAGYMPLSEIEKKLAVISKK